MKKTINCLYSDTKLILYVDPLEYVETVGNKKVDLTLLSSEAISKYNLTFIIKVF